MNSYLEKHSFCKRLISVSVVPGTFLIVVIPCHDEPELITTLKSLYDCDTTASAIEVIIVVNSGKNDDEKVLKQNIKTLLDATLWIKNHPLEKISFRLIHVKDLPKKHAGVGLARKIGMDEAVLRFDDIASDDGVIVCLDADCTVDANYLSELERHFRENPKAKGCSVYFEHPLEGNEFEQKNYEGIINYELFLRYYVLGLQYTGFPYAFQTVGSCMAVRSAVYQKQGGMNRRKAGEDFYFLHKIFHLGDFSTLNTTRVIPSPRPSHRVPFGTGSAMNKYLDAGNDFYPAYYLQSFIDLQTFFKLVPEFYHEAASPSIPESLQKFLSEKSFSEKLDEARLHSASQKMFVKRFFNWFDGFMVLKYMHFARDLFYPSMEITEAAKELIRLSGRKLPHANPSAKELLLYYRDWERKE